MESEEEFSNCESYKSQPSNSFCQSVRNSSSCANALNSLVEADGDDSIVLPQQNVRRSASGVFRDEQLNEDDKQIKEDIYEENNSIFYDDQDPFHG